MACFACCCDTFCPIDYSIPSLPKELLEPGWDETQEVIYTYQFHNEMSYRREVEFADKKRKVALFTQIMSIHVVSPVCLLCIPCHCLQGQAESKTIPHNTAQSIWSRRLALTRNGIVYRTLTKNNMGPDNGNCCASCCGIVDTYPHLVIPQTTKTVPYEKVQDVRIKEAVGSTQIVWCCCGSEQIANVDNKIEIDTSGRGIELSVDGLIAAEHLKKTIFALKNGREVPAPVQGVLSGSVSASNAVSHQVAMMTENKTSTYSAPRSVEMSRVGVSAPSVDASASSAVMLQAISSLNQTLSAQHAELIQHLRESNNLLRQIASKN